MRAAVALCTAPLLVLTACGGTGYGTGLPDGDTVRQSMIVLFRAHGTTPKQRVRIEWRNVPGKRSQQFEKGQFWHVTLTIPPDGVVWFRLRNRKGTGEVECTATWSGKMISHDKGDLIAGCGVSNL